MFKMNDIRDKLQKEAFDQLFRYDRLILRWGTSVGKSRVFVDAVNYMILSSLECPTILLVVAERAHVQNWKDEFIKVLGEVDGKSALAYVTIICYASLKKWRNTHWTLACFDEGHHMDTSIRREIICTMSFNRMLILSATVPKDLSEWLSMKFGDFHVNRVSLQDAIDVDILPEPRFICMELMLSDCVRDQTVEMHIPGKPVGNITDIWPNRWTYLKNRKKYAGYSVTLKCTEKEKYDYLNGQFEYYKRRYFEEGGERLKNMFLQWGSRRKRCLGDLKTSYVFPLIKSLRTERKRFICFCSSILQAEVLGGKNSVHSKNSFSFNLIGRFNRKESDELFAVGMLTEGQNLKDIQTGVIVQLDGTERLFIQKSGRAMRAENPEIIIFYFKDTKDEDYLKKALEGVNKEYVTYRKIRRA